MSTLDPSFRINNPPLQILVVEDQEPMANAILDKLEFLRARFPTARLTCVGTFREGVDVVSQIPHPDVVLLDLGLPDSEWRQTIARIDEFEKRSPVLIVTGHPEDKVRELLAINGAARIEVLRKDPGMWGPLIEYVARAMARGKSDNMERITENLRLLREMIDNAPIE